MTATVLLAGGGPDLVRFQGCLADRGLRVLAAPDGFYATLLLERESVDAVLVPASLPDMEPQELGRILAEDPALRALRRIFVPLPSGRSPVVDPEAPFDLVLPAGAPAELLATMVRAAIDLEAPTPEGESGLSGTFDVVDFVQLIDLLAAIRSAGVLRVGLDTGDGQIYFDRGEVVGCAWGRIVGGAALREIQLAVAAGSGSFHYHRLGLADVARVPATRATAAGPPLRAVDVDRAPPVAAARRLEGSTGA